MRRCFVLVLLALAVFFAARPARAADRELIVPFHEGGHLVLDQLSGMRLSTGTGVSYAGPIGFAYRTEKMAGLHELETTTYWVAPSADVFVLDHFSVGGLVEIAHTTSAAKLGAQSFDIPGRTSMAFIPRIGFYAAFSDRLGLWPRIGVGWTSREEVSFGTSPAGGGTSLGTGASTETFRSMVLDLDLSLVYRFNETFFIRMGPQVGVTFGGRHTLDSPTGSLSADGSVVQFGGLTQLGVNLEL